MVLYKDKMRFCVNFENTGTGKHLWTKERELLFFVLDEGLEKNKVHLSIQQGSASILVSLFSVDHMFCKCGQFLVSFVVWTVGLLHMHTHTHTTVLQPFFCDNPVWAGARRKLLDFMVQGEINRGRHTDHPAGCHSIRTNQCPPPPSPIFFYGPDALPAAQPTVSKHWRQLVHSD